MQVKDITRALENFAPRSLQESYDNSGLQVGNPDQQVTSVLLSLDITEDVVADALNKNCNMIIAHHPLLFKGLKTISGKSDIERCVISAIKHDIAIYAIHTNLDNVYQGVNHKIADKLKLQDRHILAPLKGKLMKITTFIPTDHVELVVMAMHDAGGGQIGDYSHCSFRIAGTGTFKPLDGANPFSGSKGQLSYEEETRIEMIFPDYLQHTVVNAMKKAHPYEEVAFYLHRLENTNQQTGAGMIGELEHEMDIANFLSFVKEQMDLNVIKYTKAGPDIIKKVALCGGSGAFLISEAHKNGADAFITGDVKYHEFFDYKQMRILDIGHYESEKFTIQLLGEILTKIFPNFAVHFTDVDTNPVKFFI